MTTLMEFSGHPLVHAMGWTLLHFLWQGTLAALMLWLVLGFLGGRSSKARYGAACLALALMVAMPLITFARIASAEYKNRSELRRSSIAIELDMMLQVGIGEPAAPWPIRIAVALDRSVPWLLLAWFVGAIFFVARLNLGLMVAGNLKRAETAPPPELQSLFDDLKLRLRIVRAVRLLNSARVQVPTVIGWLRPVVLLPASCLTGLSMLQIEAIFCHELAHVRRHDYLVSVFQSVAESLLFYHPAVWWVSKQVRRERECCCDEIAVAMAGDVLAYAKALSYLEERRAAFPEFVLGANGGVLKMRIKRLLGCREDVAASQFAGLTLVALIIAIAGLYVATIARAQAKSAQPEPLSLIAPGLKSDSTTSLAVGLDQPRTTLGLVRSQPLQPLYNNWLNEDVTYIITPQERTKFLGLTNDEARDKFIVDFWKRRNPTPGSTVNSFREQHYSRIAYANQHFAADRPGWATDRGRAYIIAGAPPGPEGPLKVPAATMAGNVISRPNPVYPSDAKAAHVQGAVILRAVISKTGTIEDLQVVSGPEMLRTSALDAVNRWTYKPYLLNGEPVKVVTTITVNYSFGDSDSKGVAQPMPEAEDSPPKVATVPSSPIRVSGGVASGMLISRVDPVYPPEAKAAGVQGVVVLHAVVANDGTVTSLQVVSGPPQLTQSAIDAVKQWKYKPYLLNGEPTAVETIININYTLHDSAEQQEQSAAADAIPGLRKIGGSVSTPIVIYQVKPEMTPESRKAKLTGVVLVNLIVDTQGIPQNVHVLRGVGKGLDEKAVQAVKQYRFKPAMEAGNPVPVALNMEVNFQFF